MWKSQETCRKQNLINLRGYEVRFSISFYQTNSPGEVTIHIFFIGVTSMVNLKFLFTFLIVVILSSLLLAQDKIVEKIDTTGVYKLSDVVITATKTNTNILELANSITIIDSLEIENRNKINVFNLLQTEYGLSSTQFGPAGGLSTINIRGANAGHTLIFN